MLKVKPALFIFLFLIPFLLLQGQPDAGPTGITDSLHGPDSSIHRQLLINGRLWRSTYYNISGTEFLFTNDWLNGTVTINGNQYKGLTVKLDVMNDQLLLPNQKTNTVVVLNKKMVQNFELEFRGTVYSFVKVPTENDQVKGYVQLLYDGRVKLYKKWKKRILVNQDRLVQEFRSEEILYLKHDTTYFKIARKGDLFKPFEQDKQELRKWIREERIKLNLSNINTLIPLLRKIDLEYM